MTALFGAKRPTAKYPRFVWNGITLDFDDPVPALAYEDVPVAGSNLTASGLREVLFERLEQMCTLTLPIGGPVLMRQVRRMIAQWGARGEQIEVFIDRVLRACWQFEGDAVDNNGGNPFAGVGLPTYAALSEGQGVNIPAAGPFSAALVSDLPGGSGNAFFSTAEGTLVLKVKPAWAGNDGVEHVLLDLVGANLGVNRLLVKKRVDNLLHVTLYGANGAATILEQAVAWAASTEHTLMVQWGAALADFKASLDGAAITTTKYFYKYGNTRKYGNSTKYGQIRGATPDGDEQAIDTAPIRASLGIDATGVMGRGAGVVGLLSIYAAAFNLASALSSYEEPYRTYYPRGELVGASYAPARFAPGLNLWTYQLRIRDGR